MLAQNLAGALTLSEFLEIPGLDLGIYVFTKVNLGRIGK